MNPNLHPRRVLAALVLGPILLMTPAIVTAPPADATWQVEPPTRTLPSGVAPWWTYAEIGFRWRPRTRARLFIELSDGSAYKAKPCKVEDDRGCFWDAKRRGNRRGRSFVWIKGTQHFFHVGVNR